MSIVYNTLVIKSGYGELTKCLIKLYTGCMEP